MVSVIIPVHNRFECVERAFKSLCEQVAPPSEVILVDDASDAPFVIRGDISALPFSVNVIRLQENGGPGAAREAGRLRATGDFLAYLDSDDFYAPQYFERMVAALRGSPEAGMAYCIAVQEDTVGHRTVRLRSDESFGAILPAVLHGRPWHTSGCLWRRSAADLAAPWQPLWAWEDYVHDVRAACSGVSLVHVKEPLCFVQRDREDQLGATRDPARARRGQQSVARALCVIADEIGKTPWATRPEVKHRLGMMTLTHAINCLNVDLYEESISLMATAKEWGVGHRNTALNLSHLAARARMKPLAVRLLRRCRAKQASQASTAKSRDQATL